MFGLGLGRMGLVGDLGFAIRRSLFGDGEQGLWYDLNDDSTIFQDSAGTTLATWGDPVGRVNDKSGRGNNAIQATSGSRPILGRMPKRGAVNLLRRTQEFENAYWTKVGSSISANQIIAPDGTLTGDKIVEGSGSVQPQVYRIGSAASNSTHSGFFIVKAGERSIINVNLNSGLSSFRAYFNLATGVIGTVAAGLTATIRSLGNGWYLCSATGLINTFNTSLFGLQICTADGSTDAYTGDGTSGIYIWGAQLEAGSTATNYQHVVDSLGFNVTESGQPSCGYLSFNGTNQWMQTAASVDFSATDEMSVFAGVRKAVEASTQQVIEHSTAVSANNGAFALATPTGITGDSFLYASRGTITAQNATNNSLIAPVSALLTGLSKISTDTNTTRRDGVVVANLGSNQGAGNYGNYVTYFGARAGTSLFFNGLMFSTIIRGATTSGTLLTRTEQYVARQTPTVNL